MYIWFFSTTMWVSSECMVPVCSENDEVSEHVRIDMCKIKLMRLPKSEVQRDLWGIHRVSIDRDH